MQRMRSKRPSASAQSRSTSSAHTSARGSRCRPRSSSRSLASSSRCSGVSWARMRSMAASRRLWSDVSSSPIRSASCITSSSSGSSWESRLRISRCRPCSSSRSASLASREPRTMSRIEVRVSSSRSRASACSRSSPASGPGCRSPPHGGRAPADEASASAISRDGTRIRRCIDMAVLLVSRFVPLEAPVPRAGYEPRNARAMAW